MRPASILLSASALCLSLVQEREPASRPDPEAAARHEAAALFRARCADCHVVPDPAQAADRIWLDQVRRTT